jgi:hypothetical protein
MGRMGMSRWGASSPKPSFLEAAFERMVTTSTATSPCQGILQQLDEWSFTAAERKLQMHCSEFHQWRIQFNTHQKICTVVSTVSLVPDPKTF